MHLPLHVAPIAIRCLSLAAKKAGAHVHELRASGARPQRVKVDDGLQARRRRRAGLAHEFLRRHPRVAAAVFGQQPVVVAVTSGGAPVGRSCPALAAHRHDLAPAPRPADPVSLGLALNKKNVPPRNPRASFPLTEAARAWCGASRSSLAAAAAARGRPAGASAARAPRRARPCGRPPPTHTPSAAHHTAV